MARRFLYDRKPAKNKETTKIKVNEGLTLAGAFELFIQAKKVEGVRDRTLKDYQTHWDYFNRYLDEEHPEVSELKDLTASVVRGYIDHMMNVPAPTRRDCDREKGLAPNTIKIRLRTLTTMCNFWHDEGLLSPNPVKKIKPIRTDETEELRGLTDDEIRRILISLDERQFAQWRDKVMIIMLLDTGLRINEAVNLTEDQVDFARGVLYVPSQIAKNRNSREVPFSKQTGQLLKELIRETNDYFDTNGFIFISAYGEPMTAGTVRKRFSRYADKVGLEKFSPHMLRHTFARNYLLNGGDLVSLQRILDHSDISTTRRYIQLCPDEIKKQHDKFSPIKRYLRRF